jgi:pyruvate/2-oxoglutarate/acetoin dehydrogenase E1 component
MIYARALGDALRSSLERDPTVVILGEDIVDPYGGAFKVTRGLSTDFPDRVRATPISEGALVGVCTGLAMHGYRPVVEVMFGDFLTLAFDQIANHAAKYPSMYDGQVRCPVIIRTPSGGGRGYGPTHSQSLEKHFLGIPHLRVAAASLLHDPDEVFAVLLRHDDPTLFIEHKLLYPLHLQTPADLEGLLVSRTTGPSGLPTVTLSAVPSRDCALTVVAYGYQAALAARLLEPLAVEEELFVELVVPTQLAPPDWEPIERSVAATGALVTLEEGTAGWSWGTGIAEHIGRVAFGRLRRPPSVATSAADIVPSAKHLEDEMILGAAGVEQAIRDAG